MNIFVDYRYNGLATDKQVLEQAIKELGHEPVFYLEGRHNPAFMLDELGQDHQAEINIHLEKISLKHVGLAKHHWFIPNPEWYTQSVEALDQATLVVCKTQEAVRIFSPLAKTYFLGFTSPDCYDPKIKKDFQKVFHYQGAWFQDDTFWVKRAWSVFGESLPKLTILQHDGIATDTGKVQIINSWLEEKAFKELLNSSGIHICTSSTEGFGHMASEAMSAAGIVITLDAPPMNECISDKECLLHAIARPDLKNRATLYHFDPRDLVKTLQELVKKPIEELQEKGQKNRQIFLDNYSAFKQRLRELFLTID